MNIFGLGKFLHNSTWKFSYLNAVRPLSFSFLWLKWVYYWMLVCRTEGGPAVAHWHYVISFSVTKRNLSVCWVRLSKVQMKETALLLAVVLQSWTQSSEASTGKIESERNLPQGGTFEVYSCYTCFVLCRDHWSLKMKCPGSGCGHIIVEKTAKFCSECGLKLHVQPANTQGK